MTVTAVCGFKCYDIPLCSPRFNMDIRHIKITSSEGLYRINDKKAFKGLTVSLTPSSSQRRGSTVEPSFTLVDVEVSSHSNTSHISLTPSFSLQELIQYYQQNSLKEYFKDVDTTLCTPYKQPEQSNSSNNTLNSTPGTAPAPYYDPAKEQLMGVLAVFQRRTNPA